jgi:hypothetical protein
MGTISVALAAVITLVIVVAAFGFLYVNSAASSTTVSSNISFSRSSSNSSSTQSTTISSSTQITATSNFASHTTILPTEKTTCCAIYFGNANMGPSGMLVPANTLIWADFSYGLNASYALVVYVSVYVFANNANTSIATALYGPDGKLMDRSTQIIPSLGSRNAPNGTANQIVSIPNSTPTRSFGVDMVYNAKVLYGQNFSFAFIASQSVWVNGWSGTDRSQGSGSLNAPWLIPATYEALNQPTLPQTLPQANATLSFEMQVSGIAIIPEE